VGSGARFFAGAELCQGAPKIREVLVHGFGTKLPDGLQKSLRLGSFCQNFRKDCKSNIYNLDSKFCVVGIIHRGAVSRFDPFHVRDRFAAGERFIRSALQPASRTVKRKGRRKRSALEDDRTSNAGP
jgi:hypothetical protein